MILLVALNAILGAVWRRKLGEGKYRTFLICLAPLLTWPLWVSLPWEYALGLSIAFMVLMSDGHQWQSWWIVVRYPVIGIIYPLGERFWPSKYTEVAEYVIGGWFAGLMALPLLW